MLRSKYTMIRDTPSTYPRVRVIGADRKKSGLWERVCLERSVGELQTIEPNFSLTLDEIHKLEGI